MSVLVGKKAPGFSAQAIINGEKFVKKYSLDQFLGKQSVIFFFYPKDFTFVCPTELFGSCIVVCTFFRRSSQL